MVNPRLLYETADAALSRIKTSFEHSPDTADFVWTDHVITDRQKRQKFDFAQTELPTMFLADQAEIHALARTGPTQLTVYLGLLANGQIYARPEDTTSTDIYVAETAEGGNHIVVIDGGADAPPSLMNEGMLRDYAVGELFDLHRSGLSEIIGQSRIQALSEALGRLTFEDFNPLNFTLRGEE